MAENANTTSGFDWDDCEMTDEERVKLGEWFVDCLAPTHEGNVADPPCLAHNHVVQAAWKEAWMNEITTWPHFFFSAPEFIRKCKDVYDYARSCFDNCDNYEKAQKRDIKKRFLDAARNTNFRVH